MLLLWFCNRVRTIKLCVENKDDLSILPTVLVPMFRAFSLLLGNRHEMKFCLFGGSKKDSRRRFCSSEIKMPYVYVCKIPYALGGRLL